MAEKQYKLGEISNFLKAELHGDPECVIKGIASLDKAQEQQISFLEKTSYRQYLSTTKASAVILLARDVINFSGNSLVVDNPYLSYAKLTKLFVDVPSRINGVHPQAVIGKNCNIDSSASIANCNIGNNVNIGPNTVIDPNCVIADGVTIGGDCHLYPNITIYQDVKIGNYVVIHSGAIIGADGFGIANDHGIWQKIYQLGAVQIGDNVEIGANTCIDRGALDDTIIEEGVKLDNLIQVAHNVRIGAHTAIAGCTVIAGGTSIGKHCMIGGDVCFNGHITIADQVIITGSSTVGRSIEQKGVYSSGITVLPHRSWMKVLSQLLKFGKFNQAEEQ